MGKKLFVALSSHGPVREPITEDRIQAMVDRTPRRSRLADGWKALHSPKAEGQNWSLVLPFPETYENAFKTMCGDVNHHAFVGKGDRLCIFLNDSQQNEQSVEIAKRWIATIGEHVAIRDCLDVSFALNHRTEDGDPQKAKTTVGSLCRKAKPYGDLNYDKDAARQLADLCVKFLAKMTCYESADAIVAMPPSRPGKPFYLPGYLAGKIAKALKKPDLSRAVQTIRQRQPLKEKSIQDKLKELKGSIGITAKQFDGKRVLIIDDLYQSGVSVNYLGMLLQQNGARTIFSLACEKTIGNFDNLGE